MSPFHVVPWSPASDDTRHGHSARYSTAPAMNSSPSVRSIVLLSPWNTDTLSVAWLNSRALYSSARRCYSRYVGFWSGGSSLEGLLAFRDLVRIRCQPSLAQAHRRGRPSTTRFWR